MIRVLALVLTSNHVDLMLRAVRSVTEFQQADSGLVVEVRVVVNSLNPEYCEKVSLAVAALGRSDVSVVNTESNGKPGKGHNAQLREFLHSPQQHDYALFLDGDDAYYPCALGLLRRAFESGVDVLALQTNDKVMAPWDPEYFGCIGLEARFGIRTFMDQEQHWWRKEPRLNPFLPENPVHKVTTPARLIALSRKGAQQAGIQYCERAELFDDFMAYLCIMNAWLLQRGALDVRFISNTYLYCYSTLTDNNATSMYTLNNKHASEELTFRAQVQGKFPQLAAAWAQDAQLSGKTPYLALGKPPNFGTEDKRAFVMKHFVAPALQQWCDDAAEHFEQERWAQALPLLDRLRQAGIKVESTALNAGVCHYKLGHVAEAIYCWMDIPHYKRSPTVLRNLGAAFQVMQHSAQQYAVHFMKAAQAAEPNDNVEAALKRILGGGAAAAGALEGAAAAGALEGAAAAAGSTALEGAAGALEGAAAAAGSTAAGALSLPPHMEHTM